MASDFLQKDHKRKKCCKDNKLRNFQQNKEQTARRQVTHLNFIIFYFDISTLFILQFNTEKRKKEFAKKQKIDCYEFFGFFFIQSTQMFFLQLHYLAA